MKGTNTIRAPEPGDGTQLAVQGIFPTFQAEGPYAGVPAVFLRLGGCNLACPFCDTEFESFSRKSLFDVIKQVDELSRNIRRERSRQLVVITGGEPMRQNIEPLCEALVEAGFAVQIETNGTLYRELPEVVSIVCSPKNTGQGYQPVRADLLPRIDALKFIISRRNPYYDHVSEVGQRMYNIPVYVQPMDEGDDAINAENLQFTLELAAEFGYRLSLQTHKWIGIE